MSPKTLFHHAPKVKKVFVRFDAFSDREISGTIKEIGKEASKTTRTYPVTLTHGSARWHKNSPGNGRTGTW